MKTRKLVAQFLRHCELEQLRPSTLRHYRSQLGFLTRQFGNRRWQTIKRQELIEWLYESMRNPDGTIKSPYTERARKVAVQRLQKYARRFHKCPRILKKSDLRKPSGHGRERIATPDETARILALAPSVEWSIAYRFLRLTGARPCELCVARSENIETVDGVRSIVLRRHKTSRRNPRPRVIYLGESVAPVVTSSLADRKDGPVFIDERGRQWSVARLSNIFRRIRRRLKIDESLKLYSTRHEFGTRMTELFGVMVAQMLLGHTSVNTTQRYVHLPTSTLVNHQEAMADIIPVDHQAPDPAATLPHEAAQSQALPETAATDRRP